MSAPKKSDAANPAASPDAVQSKSVADQIDMNDPKLSNAEAVESNLAADHPAPAGAPSE